MFRQPISWKDIDRLHRDMDKLFESTLPRWQRQKSANFPAINVYTNKEEGILLMAELPGVNPNDLNISVTGDTLTITGSRLAEKMPDSVQYHRQERGFGEFHRTFQLPYSVNKNDVAATVQNGILRVTLPRAEAEKPRQIPVAVG